MNSKTMICEYINQLMLDPCNVLIDLTTLEEEHQEIGICLRQLEHELCTSLHSLVSITDGVLDENIIGKTSYAGAIKDLQSSLKHLNWQVSRVAAGDYMQQVRFLGEFSESFNLMIQQLKEREQTTKENNHLIKELAHRQMELLEYEIQNQIDHYQQFAKSMEETQKYRHDMNNHMLCIDTLLLDNEIDEARAYINSISTSFITPSQPLYGENFIFHALLREKLIKAETMQVKIIKDIQLERKLNIENKDWCILFGNLLDNALESLEKVEVEQRQLFIYVVDHQDSLCVTIKNTTTTILTTTKTLPNTSKKDTRSHGIGLKNVKDCVGKYNGEMQFEVKHNMFTFTFVLFNI